MAFTQEETLVPTSIGEIYHFLDDLDGSQSFIFNLEVLDQSGNRIKILEGDEVQHTTPTQRTQLQSFMAARRAALPTDLGWAAGHVPGRITWRFRDIDGTNPNRSLYARVIENDEFGQFVAVHKINDQLNMSGAQISAAIQFLDDQRTLAVTQIIP